MRQQGRVTGTLRVRRLGPRMPDHLAELGAVGRATRAHPMDAREQRVVAAGIGESPLQQFSAHLEVINRLRQLAERSGPQRPRCELGDKRPEELSAPRDVSTDLMHLGGSNQPRVASLAGVGRRQPRRFLQQLGRGLRGAAGGGHVGPLLDHHGERSCRSLGAGGGVPGPLLGIVHGVRQPPLHGAPLRRRGRPVMRRGEEWVREPHVIACHLDDLGLDRSIEMREPEVVGDHLQQRQCRVRCRGDRQQRLAGRLANPGQPPRDRLGQRVGDREVAPAIAASLELVGDGDGVQRISARGVVDPADH